MKFVMNRNHTVASKSGHSIKFVKGKPVHVPKVCHHEVIAAGAVAADGEGDVEFESVEKVIEAPSDPAAREELIAMACADIKKRDERADFTASGAPKAKAVAAITQFDVHAKEIAEVWAEMNQSGE